MGSYVYVPMPWAKFTPGRGGIRRVTRSRVTIDRPEQERNRDRVRFFRPLPPIPRDVWGYQSLGQTRTVDAHACRLRKKLGGERWVVSVRGVGYRLVAAE